MHLSASSSAWKRWLALSWSFIEVMLFGGLVYGWGSLVFVLKDEGIYENLCQNDIHVNKFSAASNVMSTFYTSNRTSTVLSTSILMVVQNISTAGPTTANLKTDDSRACSLQDERFALCFAIATALFLFSSVIMGQINYKFGTRITRLIALHDCFSVCFTAGSLMLALTSVDVPWLIFPGLSMIAIGGLPLMVTDVQVGNSFTKGKATIAAGLCGVFDMSAGVQLVVKLVYESGFSRQNMFLVITAAHSLTLVSTFGIFPKMFISADEDNVVLDVTGDAEQESKVTVTSNGKATSEVIHTSGTEDLNAELGNRKSISQFNYLKQPLFITHCVWFCVLQLKFYYFVGSMNTYLNRILQENKYEVSYFTNVGLYIMMGGLFSSFCTGMIYDWQKKRYQSRTDLSQKAMPAVPPLVTGSILCLLFSIMTIFKSEAVIYPVFICMTVFRSFLYGATFIFVNAVFPSEYFGFLMGVVYTVGGAVSLLQYALFTWAEAYNNAALHADILLLVLVLISFCHPTCIWFMCNMEDRKYRVKTELK